jgi:uncharacterized membrane protein affecting hemolysin expression
MRGELSRENRKSFLAANQKPVNNLAQILIKQNQPEKAFEWLNLATTADLADYNRLIDAKVYESQSNQYLLEKYPKISHSLPHPPFQS